MKNSIRPTLTLEFETNWVIKVEETEFSKATLKIIWLRPIEETAIPIQMALLTPPLMTPFSLLCSSLGINVGSLTFKTTNDTKRTQSMMKIPGPGPKDLKYFCVKLCSKIVLKKYSRVQISLIRSSQKLQSRKRFGCLAEIYEECQTWIDQNHFPWYPDDWDECHDSEPGQGEVKHVVEFQQSSNCADEKNRKVGQAKS